MRMTLDRVGVALGMNGVLVSNANAEAVIKVNLSPAKQRALSFEVGVATHNNYVVCKSELFDEPQIDPSLASFPLGAVEDFGSFKMCHPKTVLALRTFKGRPLRYAGVIGMRRIVEDVLSPRLLPETRIAGYRAFNRLIGLDREQKKDSFFKVVSLLPSITTDMERYQEMVWGLSSEIMPPIVFGVIIAEALRVDFSSVVEGKHYDKRVMRLARQWLKENEMGNFG